MTLKADWEVGQTGHATAHNAVARQLNTEFNVIGYGAMGDGAADDTTAIQAAITAAQAVGGVVVLPPGVYGLSAPLSITAAVALTGYGATLKYLVGTTFAANHKALIYVRPTAASIGWLVIEGLTIDGNRANVTYNSGDEYSPAIEIAANGAYNISNIWLTRLTIQNVQGDGITVRGDPSQATNPTNVHICHNTLVSWLDTRQGIAIIGGVRVDISGNVINNANASSSAIDVEPSNSVNTCQDIAIFGNVLAGNGGAGIAVSNTPEASVTGIFIGPNEISTSLTTPISIGTGVTLTKQFAPGIQVRGAGASATGVTAVAEGTSTLATGDYSRALGRSTFAFGSYSEAGGNNAKSNSRGEWTRGSFVFAANGDAQHSLFTAGLTTANDTPVSLHPDGNVAGEYLAIPNQTAWAFHVLVVGTTDNAAKAAAYELTGLLKHAAGTVSIVGSVTQRVLAESDAAWDATVVADDTNKALAVQVTGKAGDTIQWLASVRVAAVTF